MYVQNAYIYSVYILFSHEPSLAKYPQSLVQYLAFILAHRPMAQWLPHRIQPFYGSSPVESPFTHSRKSEHTQRQRQPEEGSNTFQGTNRISPPGRA